MINYRTKAIVKREVIQQIFSKRFIFATLSLPIFMLIVFGLQFLFMSFEGGGDALRVFAEDQNTLDLLESQLDEIENNNPTDLQVAYQRLGRNEFDVFIDENRESILEGDINGVLFVPATALDDKEVFFYSNNAGNQVLLNRIRTLVNNVVLNAYINSRNMDDDIIEFVRMNVSVQSLRITESGTAEGDASGQQGVAIFFNILLYISLLMVAAPAMAAVNEEKVSRVVEVVLSSVSPSELMAGKIVGSAIAGFTQMFIWLIPVVLVVSGSVPLLLVFSDLDIQLGFFMLLYFLLNYLIGVLTFLSIFSAFGAMFDNPQDAQSSMFPVMLLIIVPFFLAFSVVNNPTSMLGIVGSLLPFFSILVMPARMVLIDVPFWQFVLAILVNLVTLYFVVILCGKIYRFTILMTGKRPSWKEIFKWMRYS
jgi:ABC-2 type transport system permease protein